ncbi:MAG: type phosphodiesterase/nucleotide pyrophosphatase [Bacteroidetes bacterium]|nr:type phosphodiesterase/nucleotide pyrophosphatase [Bacteroidota bacterium]
MRNKILLLFIFISSISFAQSKSEEPPRLLIGIKVDGMQPSHIQKLWNYLTIGGFRKILTEGTSFERMEQNIVSAGSTADVATLFTGTVPFYHGITGDYYYNRKEKGISSILNDENQVGIGTRDKLSAHKLLASTLTDELILASPQSAVYSIALNPEDAIMMGGHTATSVTWIDDTQNKWATTGYYTKGLTHWADQMNVSGSFKTIASNDWQPLSSISSYINPTAAGSRTTPFRYNPLDSRKNSTKSILRNTPAANSLVTELAQTIFNNEKLGEDKYTDALLLQYTVITPNQTTSTLLSAEQEDMYLRLDRDIQKLVYSITAKIGTEKVVLFLIGGAEDLHSPVELGNNKIPAGYFNANRSLSLVNTFLMAIYGQEKWISGYYGKNIFLNRSKIEEKKLNFQEVQRKVVEFLMEFEGIQAAYPINDIVNFSGNSTDIRTKYRNSYHRNTAGDIVITLFPGWVEVDDNNQTVGAANSPQVFVPFYLYGGKIKSQKINTDYQTIDIAPSLSNLLGIPIPNACVGKTIIER